MCRARNGVRLDSTQKQQIVKRQLRVVNTFGVLAVPNAMTRNFQRLTHRIEMETDYSRR